MKKYDDYLEKILTAVFGGIGTMAIFINLFLKGLTPENILDALKDIAGLVVVIAVFLVANKLFRKGEKFDFVKLFESHLKDWIDQNAFLISDENIDEEGKGKFHKRYCSMVIDHSNIVTRKKYAKDANPKMEKGAFVYLPYEDESGKLKSKFDFRFNPRTFERQNHYKTENGEVDLKSILEQFAMRINDNFKTYQIEATANPSNKTIIVSFEQMEQTKENARKLIELVEFVKTLVLALA